MTDHPKAEKSTLEMFYGTDIIGKANSGYSTRLE